MENEDLVWGPQYANWTIIRTRKLISILGEEWFLGKRVLDVGCGHGNNGRRLWELGAKLVFTDARPEYVERLKSLGFEAQVMDNDKGWTVPGPFDLIVHWGLLYHLDNWKQDIRCAVERSPLICLESTIGASSNPEYIEKPLEPWSSGNDHAFNGVGTILNAKHLENYLTELGCTFVRYDDTDLDGAALHCYSWKDTGGEGYDYGHRRFWIIRR